MTNKRKKFTQNQVSSSWSGTKSGSEVVSGQSVPLSRQRAVKYDKQGNQLIKLGVQFRRSTYEQYRRIAFFRRMNTYDLINEAMEAYLPTLKHSYTEKLKEAGQEVLPIR